jgi:hypothetical protein
MAGKNEQIMETEKKVKGWKGPKPWKLSKEENRKGGSQSTMAKSVSHMRICVPNCPLFPCPYQPLSKTNPDKKGRPQCALNCGYTNDAGEHVPMNESTKARIFRLLYQGKEGIIRETAEALTDMALKKGRDQSVKAASLYVERLINYGEFVFGKTVKQEVSGSLSTGLTAEDFKKAFEQRQKPNNNSAKSEKEEENNVKS